jgi:hypothetical protein
MRKLYVSFSAALLAACATPQERQANGAAETAADAQIAQDIQRTAPGCDSDASCAHLLELAREWALHYPSRRKVGGTSTQINLVLTGHLFMTILIDGQGADRRLTSKTACAFLARGESCGLEPQTAQLDLNKTVAAALK